MNLGTEAINAIKQDQSVPEGYKLTEVGMIPEDWVEKPMKDIASVNQGLQIAIANRLKYPKEDSKKYITIQYLNKEKEAEYITRYTESVCCSKEDVLITRTGNTGIIVSEIEGVFHNNFFKVKYNKEKVLKNFLIYYLEQHTLQEVILKKAGTSTIPDLNHNDFYSIPFISPPTKREQSAIATALSDVDNLIESLDKLIAKKKAIKQATMQQLLTGEKRLPGFSGEWETWRLGDLGDTYGGLTGKTKSDFGEGNSYYVPFLNVMTNTIVDVEYLDLVNVSSGEKQSQVKNGDIIFNGTSETPEEVGMCAAVFNVESKLYLNSFCIGFRVNKGKNADSLYLAYYFRGPEGRKVMQVLAQGATRYNLSKKYLKEIAIPLPEFEEQKAISSTLSDIDSEIEALEKRKAKTQQIKEGMMQELLTGRTRLVNDKEKVYG